MTHISDIDVIFRDNIRDFMRWNGNYEDLLLTKDENLQPGYKMDYRKALIVNSDHKEYVKVIDNEWAYAGGCTGSHLNYFLMIQDEFRLVPPPTQALCICGHEISENCYIRRLRDNFLLVVGNCCIKKTLRDKARRTCSNCLTPHKNRNHNLCHNCSKKLCHNCATDITTLIERKSLNHIYCQPCFGYKVGFGEYRTWYYRQVLDEKRSYCQWLMLNYGDSTSDSLKSKQFKDWLAHNGLKLDINEVETREIERREKIKIAQQLNDIKKSRENALIEKNISDYLLKYNRKFN